MKKKIIILTDYKGSFGSKYDAKPYNSGLDKSKLKKYFLGEGIEIEFLAFSEVSFSKELIENNIFVHDSIEDTEYQYKTFMEDVVYALEINMAKVLPGYRYLRAHNNKVFMEMLRVSINNTIVNNLSCNYYGCYEDFLNSNKEIISPIIIKGAEDAQGRQVRLGKNKSEAIRMIKKISRRKSFFREIWEIARAFKYKNYIKESKFRGKFILQGYVSKLQNDWKVLVFGDKYYILKRGIPPGDFRASGSRYNYGFGSQSEPPEGIFDFAHSVFNLFNVPYISIDVAFDGRQYYLIEFQFVSFGSSTHLKSDCYFINENNNWVPVFKKIELEKLYSDSIIKHIKINNLLY